MYRMSAPPSEFSTSRPGSISRRLIAIATSALLLLVAVAIPADASHTTITWKVDYYSPPPGTAFNGYRVFLSAPRHGDSGTKGELGWEENINGRHTNSYAAAGDYYIGGHTHSSPYRNLAVRGYKVAVSANLRDGNWIANRTASYNYGADIQIITHSNGGGGNYTLTMYDATNPGSGQALADKFAKFLDPPVPGTRNTGTDVYWFGSNLDEFDDGAPLRVYVELFFHDTQSHVNWFQGGGGFGNGVKTASWRYGYSIDSYLGYP